MATELLEPLGSPGVPASTQRDWFRSLQGRSLVHAMLDHEAAMARAQARVGLLAPELAQSIASTCKAELFDVEAVLRESLEHDRRAQTAQTPLTEHLRATVHLFNPMAAGAVFRGGHVAALHHNALLLCTHRLLSGLLPELQALAARLDPQTPQGRDLLQASQRLRDGARTALCLHPASAAMVPVRQAEQVRLEMAAELSLPQTCALVQEAPGDHWAALGCAFGLLSVALGRVAESLPQPGLADLREGLSAQARRAPLAMVQWMSEACLHAGGSADARRLFVRDFWGHAVPLWSALAGEAARAAQSLSQALWGPGNGDSAGAR